MHDISWLQAEAILEAHVEHRRQEKEAFPGTRYMYIVWYILHAIFICIERFFSKTAKAERHGRTEDGQLIAEKGYYRDHGHEYRQFCVLQKCSKVVK